MRKVISTPDAPSLWTQGIKVGDHIYLAGTVGADPKTNLMVGETIEEQTRQAVKNCEAILKAAGSSLDDVVQVIVLLKEPTDGPGFQKEYKSFFPAGLPPQMMPKLGITRDIQGIPIKVSIAMTAVAESVVS